MEDSRPGLVTEVEVSPPAELTTFGPDEFVLATLPDGRLEVLPSEGGELVAFAYSTVYNLESACGRGQPWTRASAAAIARWAEQAGDRVVFAVDAAHPAGRRYPEPDPLDFEPIEYAERATPLTEVWLPTRPVRTGAPTVQVELFAVTPDEPMLLAYQSPEELRACCGPYQDAASIDPANLDAVIASTGAAGVLFGAVFAEEIRNQAPVLDWTAHDLFSADDQPGSERE